MALKLSSRQQAQLGFLQALPPKLEQVKKIIELMAVLQADEAEVRRLARILDENKSGAQGLGLNALAETLGSMAMISRRGGGLQMKVRGLREGLGSLKINYEGAMRAASTPEAADEAAG